MFFIFNSVQLYCVPGSFGEVYRGEWHGTVCPPVNEFLIYHLNQQYPNEHLKNSEAKPTLFSILKH
jgi:hypothetical protein